MTHAVRQIVTEIEVDDHHQATQYLLRLEHDYKPCLAVPLEEALKSLDLYSNGQSLPYCIERLEIDLGEIDSDRFFQIWPEKLKQAAAQKLTAIMAEGRSSDQDIIADAVEHHSRFGSHPWWLPQSDKASVQDLLKKLSDYQPEMLEKIATDTSHAAKSDKAQDDTNALAQDALYVEASGIIILWPFLERLFRQLQLCPDKGEMTMEGRHMAILCLLYLAGVERDEDQAVFPLFNCLMGLEPDHHLPEDIVLEEEAQKACDQLLLTIQSHLPPYADRDPALFQSDFFQREGALSFHHDFWRLNIATMPQDILLDHIPWPLSVVALPWMAFPIMAYWNPNTDFATLTPETLTRVENDNG